ncbi:MAG: amylosucrase [Spirochaetaceae bacterium]|nr:amylosucrase [Spirochaetaceae bacterium]
MSLVTEARRRAATALGAVEGEAVAARLELRQADLAATLEQVYGAKVDAADLVERLVDRVLDAACSRPKPLRVLDRRREIDPSWFQDPATIGYVCYADRFAGDLSGVRRRLDYLGELGITYLHLMPLLRPRDGDNDGGYAVVDYGSVDPRLGTMADLVNLAGDLHSRGMSLCIDLVLNHTAAEHPWALAAAAGDPAYRAFYRVFADRELPDRFERTLPEVFPDQAPGSFTQVDGVGWVWATFNDYQWDLDWSNPEVFDAMLTVVLDLANRGVDVLRLDAAPFLWKREGTDSQNQPEVHLILQALRACCAIAAPGVLFKAEAIVAPQQLTQYLGAHDRFRPECDLAYHNQLMVTLWSTLATRDVTLARQSLTNLRPAPSSTAWVTYLRCHDDIGWAVSDEDARAVGLDPAAHRRFLSDFYSGAHPGSFARGALFQLNPRTGDSRISGTAAALCGLDAARSAGDDEEVAIALRRLLMLYSVVYSFGGIPLLYMGDELALPNDERRAQSAGQAEDNRWMHRPRMDWAAAQRRHEPASVEGRAFAGIAGMAAARARLAVLQSGTGPEVLDTGDRRVLAFARRHPGASGLVALANFSDDPVLLPRETALPGLSLEARVVQSSESTELTAYDVALPSWGHAWVTDP